MGDALNAAVLAPARGDTIHRVPGPDAVLEGGDELIVRGSPTDLENFRALLAFFRKLLADDYR